MDLVAEVTALWAQLAVGCALCVRDNDSSQLRVLLAHPLSPATDCCTAGWTLLMDAKGLARHKVETMWRVKSFCSHATWLDLVASGGSGLRVALSPTGA